MGRYFVIVALLALWLWPRPAAAVGDLRRAEARELYQKGMRHYDLGDFNTAITEFKAAYELSAAPGLLFNLGQVYRVKNDYPQALHFYRTYLRLSPRAHNRGEVEALIRELSANLERHQAPADGSGREKPALTPPPPLDKLPPPTAATPPPPGVVPTGAATTRAPAIVPVAALPRANDQRLPSRRDWRAETWAGGALALVGVGALAAGIGLGVRSQSRADQLTDAADAGNESWSAARAALYRDGQRDATAATALYVVGGVAAAGGAVLLALGLHDRRARHFAALPQLSATGLTWHF